MPKFGRKKSHHSRTPETKNCELIPTSRKRHNIDDLSIVPLVEQVLWRQNIKDDPVGPLACLEKPDKEQTYGAIQNCKPLTLAPQSHVVVDTPAPQGSKRKASARGLRSRKRHTKRLDSLTHDRIQLPNPPVPKQSQRDDIRETQQKLVAATKTQIHEQPTKEPWTAALPDKVQYNYMTSDKGQDLDPSGLNSGPDISSKESQSDAIVEKEQHNPTHDTIDKESISRSNEANSEHCDIDNTKDATSYAPQVVADKCQIAVAAELTPEDQSTPSRNAESEHDDICNPNGRDKEHLRHGLEVSQQCVPIADLISEASTIVQAEDVDSQSTASAPTFLGVQNSVRPALASDLGTVPPKERDLPRGEPMLALQPSNSEDCGLLPSTNLEGALKSLEQDRWVSSTAIERILAICSSAKVRVIDSAAFDIAQPSANHLRPCDPEVENLLIPVCFEQH